MVDKINYLKLGEGWLSVIPSHGEEKRLETLRDLEILDTPAGPEFERITKFASEFFGVPIAVISLVDENRQWFKSCFGLDVKETPRDIAFCSHAIWQDKVMIIPDTHEDNRFRGNPLVTGGPMIRFYAGAPLKTKSGHALGTLCVIDSVAHAEFTETQQKILNFLASLVVDEFELRSATLKLKEGNTALKQANEQKEEMIEKLLKVNGELERFAYICSHDLKEPLLMIRIYAEKIAEIYKSDQKNSTSDDLKFIEYVILNSGRAQQLVSEILEYSQVDHQQETEQLDLNEIVSEVMTEFEPIIIERGATILCGVMPVLKSNRVLMKQLFSNMISNSIKYCERPPLIKIAADKNDVHIHLKISDNGIGIDKKYHDKIFQVFERLHSRSEYSGTGIGLAICKKIVEKHSGKLRVESSPGEGSTFHIYLGNIKNTSEL